MQIGYARTSTVDQRYGLEDQKTRLAEAGCGKIYHEHGSGADDKRPQLEEALAYAREGDTIVVVKLDRLGRSIRHLIDVVAKLQDRGIGFRSLGEGVDTTTPTGRFTLNIFAALAEFERDLMLERQRVGIEAAREEGKHLGRKPTVMMRADDIRRMRAEGMGPTDIARKIGCSRSSVYRALKAASSAECPSA